MPLLRAIGPALRSVRLTAPFDRPSPAQPTPAATSADVDWHAVEQSGATRFRWTRTSRIEWRLQDQPGTYPCRLTITIPLVHEISAGFAERCMLEIGSYSHPVQRAAGAITAVAELDQPLRQPIALITPEPLRPSDLLGTSDRRALGLAIALAAEPG
jgi:hypothetical protein